MSPFLQIFRFNKIEAPNLSARRNMNFDSINAAHMANFVKFAYNMFAVGGLTPKPDPGIASAGFDLLYYLDASDFDDKTFYGYIAASKTSPGELVLAIRGTQTPLEWLLDFIALPFPFTPAPDAGFVALGFLSIFDTFDLIEKATGNSMTLSGAIKKIAASTRIQSLTVIGHSLGAALATLAAAELAVNNVAGVRDALTLYTFGSPRVGLLDFAASFDSVVPTSFRVWNTLDIVPQFPTFPYIHVSGLGDAIVQTEEQLSTLAITPTCEHHLTSYQWLLDTANFALDSGCVQTAQPAMAAAASFGRSLAQSKSSARVLRKAMCGRL